MRQPDFPFLILDWRRSLIMMVFREENVLFFGQNKHFGTAARTTNRRGAAAQTEKAPHRD